MNLKEKLNEDMRKALREKDTLRLSTIRLLLAAIKNLEIAKGKDKELKESDFIGALSSETKKRKEAIEGYKKGKREELVEKETRELEIIKEYLPEELSPEELGRIIEETIEEVGAKDPKDMGKVMGAVMVKVKGRAEGKVISQLVKEKLTKHESMQND
ncbi:MAG TPA: GatB/YqeY domain-containing protein [bacterium]|nr:GatB/YqeY domain-containing protein [bacterium]